jgi:hypothetical protein
LVNLVYVRPSAILNCKTWNIRRFNDCRSLDWRWDYGAPNQRSTTARRTYVGL